MNKNLRTLCLTVLLAAWAGIGYFDEQCEKSVRGSDNPGALCPSFFARDDALADRAYRKAWAGFIEGPDGATALFERAVKANPASPFGWSDLGEALLGAGQPEQGRRCFVRAVELGPHTPQILLRAANFHFRLGATDAALGYAAQVLAIVPDYDAIIFNLYKRLDVGTDAVLSRGLPRDRRAAKAFFRYTLSSGASQDAALVWGWLRRNSFNDDGLANEYAGYLIRMGQYEEAAKIWAAQMGTREEGYMKSTWLCNEDFSREPSGATFDWRITPVAGARFDRDAAYGIGPHHFALRIEFDGEENLAFTNVDQTAFVKPGGYRLSALMRTETITTDEGVSIRIFDRADPARLDIRTRPLCGTVDWTRVQTDFQVPAGVSLLDVQVYRRQSLQFDNKIRGSVWIGQVRLERANLPTHFAAATLQR